MGRLSPSGRSFYLILTFAAVLVLAGCARPTGSIKGKVTYDGKILKNGNIQFVSTEGQTTSSAQIMEDGTYVIPSITVGDYKVVIETESYNPNKGAMGKANFTKDTGPQKPPPGKESKVKGGPAEGATVPEGYHPSNPAEAAANKAGQRFTSIPDKYQKVELTPLTYTAVAGSQTKDFDLTK